MDSPQLTLRSLPQVKGKPHPLRKNPGSERPVNLLFLDTETEVVSEDEKVQWQRFRLGVTCHIRRRPERRSRTETWKEHDTKEGLLERIIECTREKTALYVYASNPSFDLWVLGFYSYFARKGWKARFIYDEGMRFILTCYKGKRAVKVCAVQNYFDGGVRSWGEMLGIPKLECDVFRASDSELYEYCKRDVEITKEAMLSYIGFTGSEDLGKWGLTLSSQAMNTYRHRFLRHRFWVHKSPDVLELERRAYFGGRSECYFTGHCDRGPFVELDVNSLYPYVMARYPYPYNFSYKQEEPSIEDAERALKTRAVVAEVELETTKPYWAVPVNNRTCFPVGRFTTWVCSMGLWMALRTGALRKINRMAVYKRGYVFTAFVEWFYQLRKRFKEGGMGVWEKLCKKLMNSLYGKFGQANPALLFQDEYSGTGFFRYNHLPADGGAGEIVTYLMGRRFVEQGREEHRDAMPALSAHVTEYGRFYLTMLLEAAGWDNVLYCDTDSLFIPERTLPLLDEYLDPYRLGALKVERCIDRYRIYGVKDYVIDGERVLKGVPDRSREVAPGVYEYEQFPKLKTLLRLPANSQVSEDWLGVFTPDKVFTLQEEGLFPLFKLRKGLSRTYMKGTVDEDGRINPFRLNEGLFP